MFERRFDTAQRGVMRGMQALNPAIRKRYFAKSSRLISAPIPYPLPPAAEKLLAPPIHVVLSILFTNNFF